MKGIKGWLADSPHKVPIVWKAFLYHDVILRYSIIEAWQSRSTDNVWFKFWRWEQQIQSHAIAYIHQMHFAHWGPFY